MTTAVTDLLFERAARADSNIRAFDRIIRILAATAPSEESGQPWCSNCAWSAFVKPMARLLVGPDRGHHTDAEDPSDAPMRPVDLAALLAERDEPDREPSTQTERWLRSHEVWEAVTNRWLKLLDDADPANGCGLPA